MSSTDYSFAGLDELESKLARTIETEYPKEFEAMVRQVAGELLARVREHTPHDTGRLRSSWKVGPIVKQDGGYYIEVYTNVNYAAPVEYGHRTRGGKRFVKGSHMMAISLDEVAAALPDYLRDWLSRFLETFDI